ncbi:MAG: TrkH family potassium uptake protein [Kiloniellales bacterium]
MVHLRPVLFIVGLFLIALGVVMALPALAEALRGAAGWRSFAFSSGATIFFGGLLVASTFGTPIEFRLREAFLLTTLSWLSLSLFAALPFRFWGHGLDYADAVFEAVSGVTTTGATVLVGLERLPPGLLLWRGLLQLLGGVGFVAMGIAILPFLRVGGMQLFRAESSDRTEKVLPRAAQITRAVLTAYLLLNVACACSYWLAGMSGFDALVHAMATVSTGGFANYDSSFGRFDSALIDSIAMVFMILGALPFMIYIRMARGDLAAPLRDSQVRNFLWLLTLTVVLLAFWVAASEGIPFLAALRYVGFNAISVATTTGFVNIDYGAWGGYATVAFFLLTFVGGCTGSTSGGIKMFRFEVMAILIRRQFGRLLVPHGVYPRSYNGRPLPEDVPSAVLAFFFVFILSAVAIALGLGAMGLDFLTSISGAVTALSNVGPGLGAVIGPAGNFSTLPDSAKWLLSFAMLLGRLELFTVMILFLPSFWRG